MRKLSPLLGRLFPGTIRSKIDALVILSVAISLALAIYSILVTPRLAVQAARPFVYNAGASFATAFQGVLQAREATVLNDQVEPGLVKNLILADAGDQRALPRLHQADAEGFGTSVLASVAFLSPTGKLLDVTGLPLPPAGTLLALEAETRGRVLFGAPYLHGATAWAVMAVPIRLKSSLIPIGVEEAVFNLSALAQGVEKQISPHLSTWQGMALVTPQGILLYDHLHRGLGKPIANRPVLQAFLSGYGHPNIYAGDYYAPNGGQRAIGVFNRLAGVGYDLYVLTNEKAPAVGMTLPVALALLALGLGAVVLYLTGRRFTQPIKDAVQAATAFGKGDLSAHIPPQQDGDFQTLATSFNAAVAAHAQSLRVETLLGEAEKELRQAQSEEVILRTVVKFACRILNGKLAVVFTPGQDGWLFPRATSGDSQAFAKNLRLSIRTDIPEGRGPGGVAFREGCFLSMRTVPPFPPGVDFRPWQKAALEYGFRHLVVSPLIHHGTTLGLLYIYLMEPSDPSAAAQDAVQALALAAASALQGLILREEILLALVGSLEIRDDETQLHALRVSLYAERLATELGLADPEAVERVRWGALLHDVGKIGLPDAVLQKCGPLTSDEWLQIHRHPAMGYYLIRHLEFLGDAREMVLHHHERFDGTGYPRGLIGEAIPLGSRIFAVADTLDAITSDRSYRNARGYPQARAEILRVVGSQLDPAVVEAFERIGGEEWERLRRHAQAGAFSRFRVIRTG